MMVFKRMGLLVSLTVAVASCGVTVRGGADYRPDLDLAPYRTFSWGEPDELPTGDPRLDHNPFFVDRLHEAIENELSAHGIRRVESNADLLVHHHASVRDRVQVYDLDRSAGYDGGDHRPAAEVFQYEEGTFLVDIAERSSREIVWRGWAQADVESALADPDRMRDLVAAAVAKMFEGFPVRPSLQ